MGLWPDELKAKRVVWRDQQFDSVLEADWAATFTAWGMEYVYHPGRLYLANSDIWEPDFQLDGDVLFEAKGEHNHRIDKATRAEAETGIGVIIGRGGWLPPGTDLEYALAVWEPDDWVVVDNRYARGLEMGACSGFLAFARARPAMRMYKAIGEAGIA